MAKTEDIRFDVEGMTCAGCEAGVTYALSGIEGVHQVSVSYEDESASVVYDSATVAPSELVSAVDSVGYSAEVLQD